MQTIPYILNQNTPLSPLKEDALAVFATAVSDANPYESTCKALQREHFGKVRFVLSIGKAAVPMMQAAYDSIGEDNIQQAVLVTKYFHLNGFRAKNCTCFEAGHPVSDENSKKAALYVLEQTAHFTADDICIVLISGGGSALFEASLINDEEQRRISDILLKSGADIYELNCVRKRLSAVKGGKLANRMSPAKIFTFALSDVPGSRPDVIASGPTQEDPVSDEELQNTLRRYGLQTDTALQNIPAKSAFTHKPHFAVVGDVKMLCTSAAKEAEKRGYTVIQLCPDLTGDAEEAAVKTVQTALQYRNAHKGKFAFIYGGETTVTVKGNGKGGRSQQAALRAAFELQNAKNIVFLAGGSDGTDGPTDAAGGLVDGQTVQTMLKNGTDAARQLADNNAYFALLDGEALLMTGPTGTNVNDLLLILTE